MAPSHCGTFENPGNFVEDKPCLCGIQYYTSTRIQLLKVKKMASSESCATKACSVLAVGGVAASIPMIVIPPLTIPGCFLLGGSLLAGLGTCCELKKGAKNYHCVQVDYHCSQCEHQFSCTYRLGKKGKRFRFGHFSERIKVMGTSAMQRTFTEIHLAYDQMPGSFKLKSTCFCKQWAPMLFNQLSDSSNSFSGDVSALDFTESDKPPKVEYVFMPVATTPVFIV